MQIISLLPQEIRYKKGKRKRAAHLHSSLVKLFNPGKGSSLAHSLVELVNTSACINELLLTCVERVAVRADIYSEVALCRQRLKCVTASTSYSYNLCLRMDAFFHCFHLSIKDMTRNLLSRMSYRITKSALLYYLNKNPLSISRERFLDRKDKRLVIRGLLHEVDDRIGGSRGVCLGDPPSDEPNCIKFFRQQEQVFPSCT